MKTIIVSCPGAVATSSIVESQVEKLLQENNIEHRIIKCPVREVESKLENYDVDLIVTSGRFEFNSDVKTINGMNLITGIGMDKVNQQILDVLKN